MIGEESAHVVPTLLARWRTGPIGPPPRPPRLLTGRRPVFSVWSWNDDRDGPVAQVTDIAGHAVVEQLRIRRDQPGGLWVLADGRYAVTGPLAAVGSRSDLIDWARRRIDRATSDERAWLQNVIGALAADQAASSRGRARPE
jgi:potassium/hydrogen antiporter